MIYKQYMSFVLSFFMLFSNMGFALHTHYCHGIMKTVSSELTIDFTNEEHCEGSHEEKSGKCCSQRESQENPCCEDNYLQADLDDVVLQFEFYFQIMALPVIEFVLPNQFSEIASHSFLLNYYCVANAPPFYTLFSQRLFYEC